MNMSATEYMMRQRDVIERPKYIQSYRVDGPMLFGLVLPPVEAGEPAVRTDVWFAVVYGVNSQPIVLEAL